MPARAFANHHVTLILKAAMTSTGPGAQGRNLDFELLNRTRYVVTHIFVAPSSSDDWGEDIMGKDVLGAGESVEVEFSRSERDCRGTSGSSTKTKTRSSGRG
jgi:hypothetical protein